MSATEELVLIAKIVDEGDMRPVLDANITIDYFKDARWRIIFKYLLDYWRAKQTAGEVPTRAMVAAKFPTEDLPSGDRLTLKATVENFLTFGIREDLHKLSNDIIENMNNVEGTLDIINKASLELHKIKRVTQDVVMSEAVQSIQNDYETSLEGGLIGIPFPWDVLNEESRGLQAQDYYVFYGRPKCVVEGQRVLSASGARCPIEEAPNRLAKLVGHNINYGGCLLTEAGTKRAVRITTRTGHVVEVGEDHPMLVPSMEYISAGKLQVGAYIGVARRLPAPLGNKHDMPAAQARLLGLLVGDGNYTRAEVQFTKADLDTVNSAAASMGATLHQTESSRPIEYRIVGKGKNKKNPVLDWLRELGCHGQKSSEKTIPDALFRCSNKIVAEYLSVYTDTGGTVGDNSISWTTASYELAESTKHLLLRFGVTGIIQPITTNFDTDAYIVSVYSQEQHQLLNRVLRLTCKYKAKALNKLATKEIKQKRQDDEIPYSDLLMNTILKAKGDKPWKHLWSGFSKGKLFRRTGRISRHLLRKLAEHLDAPELLEWADSDIRWEPIDSIEHLGERKCWDICMDDAEHPTFIVENFITHNSLKTWVLLKIATHAYDFAARRVLIYTREMSIKEMLGRVVCLLIECPYSAYKKSLLHKYPCPEGGTMEDRFYDVLRGMKEDEETCSIESGYKKSIIITTDRDDPKGGGVQGIRRKIKDHEPDLLCVDGIYLMRDDRQNVRSLKWINQSQISQDLREVAQDENLPLVVTSQAKRESEERKGRSIANVSYSDSVGQDCTAGIELLKNRINDEVNELAFVITAAREMNLCGFAINACPASDFSMKYRVARDAAGMPITDPETGEALMIPHVFEDITDMQKMFKEDNKTKGQEQRLNGPPLDKLMRKAQRGVRCVI